MKSSLVPSDDLITQNKSQYNRLVLLYRELKKELADVERNNHGLRIDIQRVVDKEKMKKILEYIVHQPG
ncbi:MAG: hypothetical protein AAB932_03480 [Patescibacteria group bacterium]